MATPTLMEFMGALITIERFLVAEAEKAKAAFPALAPRIDELLAQLKLAERTLASLSAAKAELDVILTGNGPVVHKDEDFAG
jgi:hypothetical protein